ncbi:MAG: alpha/beta hydrolase [Gammaproteobacteria bacterium]|nr:alpha/beta hydrolase [Gammaproteobacteria bacterium]
MRTHRLATAAAISVALLSTAYGGEQVTCRRADLLVALAPGQPAEYSVSGELCATSDEVRHGTTVQLLIHGATYSHDYWDFGTVGDVSYSYARATAASGLATFAFDEIGAGGSSHPSSDLVTVDVAAYVAHQIVQALRSGEIGGTRFRKVIAVGHALGSVVAWDEAIRYADVDGVIVTAAAHSLSTVYHDAQPTVFSPAVTDPRFITTGLDRGYLTTVPGVRAHWFFAAFIPEEEAHKDVVSAAELATAARFMTSTATRAVRVPVLTIVGGNDATLCGPGTQGRDFDCSSGATVATQEAPFYSGAARLHACVIPGAGHDLNLTLNHRLQIADAVAWSAAFVDPRSDRERLRPGAMDVGLKSNDGLPPNCGSARQNDGPGSRYARTSATVR